MPRSWFFTFWKHNLKGLILFSFQLDKVKDNGGIVFASIAFVMTTALVRGVTTPKTLAKEAIAVRKGYKKIEVYFPDAEYEAFLKKVKRTNLSISAFVRKMAAEQVIKEAPHADVPLLMREVKWVGNNINQLLYLANSKGFLDKVALNAALKELREVDKLIFDAYTKD